MNNKFRIYATIFVMAVVAMACNRNDGAARIRALEKQFKKTEGVDQKGLIANELHKRYSLYHLKHAHDTLFLKNWAEMALSGREYEQAADIYTKMIRNGVKDGQAFAALGQLNARLGYFGDASANYLEAYKRVERNESKKEYKGLSDFYRRTDSILNTSRQKIQAGVEVEKLRLERARALMLCRHYDAAVADINIVLSHNQDNVEAILLLAETGLRSEDFKMSEESLDKYVEIGGGSPADKKRAEAIRDELGKRIGLNEVKADLMGDPVNYDLLIDVVTRSFSLKEYNNSLNYINRLINSYPDSIYGYLYRGQVAIQLGQPLSAIPDFNKVISLKPGNISARNLKAYVYLLTGDEAKMEEEIQQIIDRGGELLEVLRSYNVNK